MYVWSCQDLKDYYHLRLQLVEEQTGEDQTNSARKIKVAWELPKKDKLSNMIDGFQVGL